MNGADFKAKTKFLTVGAIAKLLLRHQILIKYFIIGCSASAIDVIIFMLLLHWFDTTPLFAHSISVPTAVLFSFVVNARHNFGVSDHLIVRLISFIIVCVIGYAAGYGVIVVSVSMGLSASLGKFLSLPLVFVVQFVLNSRITFRSSEGLVNAHGRE